MSLWQVSVCWATAKPRFETPWLKPKFGRDGATMWKEGILGARWASDRRWINLRDWINDPGPVISTRLLMLLGYGICLMTEPTAMYEQERYGTLHFAPLMNKMDIQRAIPSTSTPIVYICTRLSFFPASLQSPPARLSPISSYQTTEHRNPIRIFQFIRQVVEAKLLLQSVDFLLGNRDPERFWSCDLL
jgi:hypothetical protein